MIKQVIIKDPKNLPCSYLSGSKYYPVGKIFNFKEGLNVIVGRNGCGKTSLLKMIYDFMLCPNSICSKPKWDSDDYVDFTQIIKSGEILDGVEIKADYATKVFRYLDKVDYETDIESGETLDSWLLRLNQQLSFRSAGQDVESSLGNTFAKLREAIKTDKLKFPLDTLERMCYFRGGEKGKIDQRNFELYKNYIINNKVETEDSRVTLIFDEPDRSIDIFNIGTIHKFITELSTKYQTILVLHNPILIYKFSKNENVNFIEFDEDYVKTILDVINN